MRKVWMRAPLAFGVAGISVLMMGSAALAAEPTVNAANDSATTTAGAAVTVHVLPNDTVTDGALDAGTLHGVADPANGTVRYGGDAARYTPNVGFAGTDTFQYEVCAESSGDQCDNATVTVTVGADTSGVGAEGGEVPYAPGDQVGAESAGSGGSLPTTGTGGMLLALLGLAFVAGGIACYGAGRDNTRALTR